MQFWTTSNVQQIILQFVKKITNNSLGDEYLQANLPIEFSANLGLSSMQIMELAAHVNSFFHLFDIAEPPALLRIKSVQGWTEAVLNVRAESDEFVTFKTSGTTGEPKLISHSIKSLIAEINYLQTVLYKPTQIISLVPSIHIYGFLFTVILPTVWSVPIVYTNHLTKEQLKSNSLIIGTPFNWNYLHSSLNLQSVNCWGVSASAPLNDDLYRLLTTQGFRITEIYGSTETAGVGYRRSASQSFSLFNYWNFNEAQNSIIHQVSQQEFVLMDDIQIQSDHTFKVVGRKDAAVQIGGYNVHLAVVKQKILSVPNVLTCQLFAKSHNNGVVIAAELYLEKNSTEEQRNCISKLRVLLKGEEYPSMIQFFTNQTEYLEPMADCSPN